MNKWGRPIQLTVLFSQHFIDCFVLELARYAHLINMTLDGI